MSRTEAILERLAGGYAGVKSTDQPQPVSVNFNLEVEQEMAAGYGQKVAVYMGVPAWYTVDGAPAAGGVPKKEARRRDFITGQLNFGRVSRLRG